MEGDADGDAANMTMMMPIGDHGANHGDCVKSTQAVLASRTSEDKASKEGPKTLNQDPFNLLAEETALLQCQQGFVVQEELTETEMVVKSCGSLIQGTPDGGFVDSDGLLRLVQVVRVPLLPDMAADAVGNTLYDTVLTKIVKSQSWMLETRTLPHDFVIFCWLPRVGAYQECLEQTDALLWTEALIWNVCSGGWPFSLRVQVPDDDVIIFPENFGLRNERSVKKDYFNKLCYCLNPSNFLEPDEDEEPMEWYLFEEEFEEDESADPTTVVNVNWVALAIQMVQDRAYMEEVALEYMLAMLGIEVAQTALNFLILLILQSVYRARLASQQTEPPLPPLIQGWGERDPRLGIKPAGHMYRCKLTIAAIR